MRALDPRFDPTLPPEKWEAAARVRRLRVLSYVAVVVALLIGGAAYRLYPVDLTADLGAAEVARQAGMMLLKAEGYRFRVTLSGEAEQYDFPTATLEGAYQREPQVVHLSGKVASGEVQVPVDYYLEGDDYYMQHPTTQRWLVVKGGLLDELTAFFPENLAAPMVGGLRGARVMARERLPGGEALRLRLDLDPAVMLPQMPALQTDTAEYQLWVYTRSLKPARFAVQVLRNASPWADKPGGDRFAYELTWDFEHLQPVIVPDEVKANASDVGAQ